MELLNDREKVSTPEKQDRTVMKLQEVSMCSTILHPNDETNATKEVNETKATDITTTGMPQSENCRKTSENILFDTERVKKAGHFLEDCRLFLSGFLESDIDKFRLAIQMAGGVCLGQLTSSITHFVAKKPVDDHYKLMEELQLKPYKVCIIVYLKGQLISECLWVSKSFQKTTEKFDKFLPKNLKSGQINKVKALSYL